MEKFFIIGKSNILINEILNFWGGHNLDIIHPIDLKSGMHLHGEQQVQGVVVVATETWNIILVVYG